jgi:enoyl-CoA hydratase/carnithine racemase
LFTVLDEIDGDDSIKAVVLTGAGRAFCSGFDFSSRFLAGAKEDDPAITRKGVIDSAQLCVRLRRLQKPVIAAVNGFAIAGGLGLAAASDVIVASEQAKFCEGHVNFASGPDCGLTYFLSRSLGTARAFEFIATGKTIDAKEAERIGLVNKVVAPENLQSAARELAAVIAKLPVALLRVVKPMIYAGATVSLEQSIENEANAQAACHVDKECREIGEAYRKKFVKA